jgi:hypothetical protein
MQPLIAHTTLITYVAEFNFFKNEVRGNKYLCIYYTLLILATFIPKSKTYCDLIAPAIRVSGY